VNALGWVASTLATAAVGFVGVWIGARLSARNQHDQWLRDRRLESYSKLSAEVTLLLHVMNDAHGTYEATNDRAAFNLKMSPAAEHLQRIQILSDEVSLVGSADGRRAMHDLTEFVTTRLTMGFVPVPQNLWADTVSGATGAITEYLDMVRPEVTGSKQDREHAAAFVEMRKHHNKLRSQSET
jgi:hypothetical protein